MTMLRKNSNQRKTLEHMMKLRPYYPFITDHPAHAFARWLLLHSSSDDAIYELTDDQVRQSLYHLEHKGFIVRKQHAKSGKVETRLTQKTRTEFLKEYNFEHLSIAPPKVWEKEWWFVMFDIPETKRHAREIFRDKLTRLGLLRIQRSVWIYPYNCEKEIAFSADFLGIKDYVLLFHGNVSQDKMLRKYFLQNGFTL